MKKYTEKIISREDLSQEEADALWKRLCCKLNDTQMAGILVALRMKGESVDEITGFAAAMRDKMVSITLEKPAIDMWHWGRWSGPLIFRPVQVLLPVLNQCSYTEIELLVNLEVQMYY